MKHICTIVVSQEKIRSQSAEKITSCEYTTNVHKSDKSAQHLFLVGIS